MASPTGHKPGKQSNLTDKSNSTKHGYVPLTSRPPPSPIMHHMQRPTCTGIRIRSTQDAHKIFYAVRRGMLHMVTRRLDADERLALRSGCIYAWEERGPHSEITGLGIERFTEGRRWSPSRVRDEFLFYYEKYAPPPSMSQTGMDDKKPPRDWDPLVKQTYSVWVETEKGKRKWHLTAYFTQATVDQLGTVDDIQGVGNLTVPDSMFHSTRLGKSRGKSDEKSGESSRPATSTVTRTYAPFPSPFSALPPPNMKPAASSVEMYQPYRTARSDKESSPPDGESNSAPHSSLPVSPVDYTHHQPNRPQYPQVSSSPPQFDSYESFGPHTSLTNGNPANSNATSSSPSDVTPTQMQPNYYLSSPTYYSGVSPPPQTRSYMPPEHLPPSYSPQSLTQNSISPISPVSPITPVWYSQSNSQAFPESRETPLTYQLRPEESYSESPSYIPQTPITTSPQATYANGYSVPGPSDQPYHLNGTYLSPHVAQDDPNSTVAQSEVTPPYLRPLLIPDGPEGRVSPSGSSSSDGRRGEIGPCRDLAPLHSLQRTHPYRRDPTDDRTLRLLDPRPTSTGPLP